MQSNYMYYPSPVQQGPNFFQPYAPVEEKTCSYKFLKAFSHLPCLPSSWSKQTRGAIGFGIFLFFLLGIIVALGLIPVYIDLVGLTAKNEFSIDVSNGLKLQNQDLFDILTDTVDSNRTIEQNITLTNQINSLTSQLNTKFRSLNPNFEKVYNVRLTPNADQSIDVSYSIKTLPVKKSVLQDIKDNTGKLIKDPLNFNQIILTNSTLSLNQQSENIKISDPILGEFPSKSSILLSSAKSDSLQSELQAGPKSKKKPKMEDLSEEQKLIQSYSNIKFLKDDDYHIKKYPIYFPSYEPPYPPQYPQPSYPPQYPKPYTQEYHVEVPEYNGYQEEKYTPSYVPEPYPTTYMPSPPEYKPKDHPVPHKEPVREKQEHRPQPPPHKLKEEKPEISVKKEESVKTEGTVKNLKSESEKDSKVKLDDLTDDVEFELSKEESVEEVKPKEEKNETKIEKPKKEKSKKTKNSKKHKLKGDKDEKKVEKIETTTTPKSIESVTISENLKLKKEEKVEVNVETKKEDTKQSENRDKKEVKKNDEKANEQVKGDTQNEKQKTN